MIPRRDDAPTWLKPMMVLDVEGQTRALWARWGLLYHDQSVRAFRRSAAAIEDLCQPESELPALLLATACNFLFHHFDFGEATWDDAPDDLFERITGSWHPNWADSKIEITVATGRGRYYYVATVLNLTRWSNWEELDRCVRKIFTLSYGEPLGGELTDNDDELLATLLYDIAWRPHSKSDT